jgi:hypothetical integral membrane protein (TIGR02206 family)
MRAAHLAALVATATAAIALTVLVRRWSAARNPVRAALAAVLLGGVTAYLVAESQAGRLSAWDFLPFHLCDFAIFVAAFALVSKSRAASEVLWFWSLSGTVLAMVTPDVSGAFPEWRWLVYFAMHGAVVVSAVVLVVGLGLRPRPGAPWRVFGWTLLYAAVVAAFDWVSGANFLYLRAKPAEPTPLDWFGPWPLYLVVAALIGLALFHLLMTPFSKEAKLD